jgi:hydroxyacylglutathione hydrolase
MHVVTIPCLKDNFAYLLIDRDKQAVVVDPSEAAPVEAALGRERAVLRGIWLTHHHWDHVGGVEALCGAHAALDVLGSAYDLEHGRIPRQTRGLREGDALHWDGLPVSILEIPGHTLGAIGYVVDSCLFSGDTLFLAGCGRMFEGTPPMMQHSLAKLRALPEGTRIHCGHEYTLANLRFAQTVEPESTAIAQRVRATAAERERGAVTVPGLLRDELATNPFLRWDAPAVLAAARKLGAASDAPPDVFASLRSAKDKF